MSELSKKQCKPCEKGTPPLRGEALLSLREQLPTWTVVDDHHLEREYTFPDFAKALEFVNRIGSCAEEQDHHPEIQLSWGRVKVSIWTHTVGGLSENDFIYAARCDQLERS